MPSSAPPCPRISVSPFCVRRHRPRRWSWLGLFASGSRRVTVDASPCGRLLSSARALHRGEHPLQATPPPCVVEAVLAVIPDSLLTVPESPPEESPNRRTPTCAASYRPRTPPARQHATSRAGIFGTTLRCVPYSTVTAQSEQSVASRAAESLTLQRPSVDQAPGASNRLPNRGAASAGRRGLGGIPLRSGCCRHSMPFHCSFLSADAIRLKRKSGKIPLS